MGLRRLCKAASSMGGSDECPAVYVSDAPSMMVVQGKMLDALTQADLQNLAGDETAVQIPTETVLRAAALFLADHGRQDLQAAIDACALDFTTPARP